MNKKTVEANLFDQFILYKGNPLMFSGGVRHQKLDVIFIIAPEFLKHELYALGSRDVDKPDEFHCQDEECFGSSYKTQKKDAGLCNSHLEFFLKNISGKFEYELNCIIFSDKERYKMLKKSLSKHSDIFSRETGVPVRINRISRRNREEVNGKWLICLRDKYEINDYNNFGWMNVYEKELKENLKCNHGNLAISVFNISSISHYGDLDDYREAIK